MIDYPMTYRAKIEASIGSTLFRHLYVDTDDVTATDNSSRLASEKLPATDVTSDGELSCAVHVSSVLVLSGLLDAPHSTVASTLLAAKAQGWYRTLHPTPGALVVWPAGKDGHSHVGFYVSASEAVSNSTILRVPVRHPLIMKDGRAPDYFLTHDAIAEKIPPLDTRNVIDKYRHQPVDDIVRDLDTSRSELEIAIENLERDFNMGTIVRTANAFNVKKVHIIGSRQWNKRGAMKTDAYLHIVYHQTVDDFINEIKTQHKALVAVDIVPEAMPLHETALPKWCVLVFGSEGPGLSAELRQRADKTVAIEQFGSTRSINVGVAAGIAMYAWVQQHRFSCTEAPSVQE